MNRGIEIERLLAEKPNPVITQPVTECVAARMAPPDSVPGSLKQR